MQEEEEEEIQAQEEEELQMQDDDDEDWETGDTKEDEDEPISKEKFQELSSTFGKAMGLTPSEQPKTQPETEKESKPNIGKAHISEDFRKKVLEKHTAETKKRAKEQSKEDIQARRESLLGKINDTTTSSEEAQKASEELRALHKNAILPNASRGAMGSRLKTLKKQAREGKEGAYEQYQKEYSKSSTYEKFLSKGAGGRTKMIASGIGKGIGKGAKKLGSGLFGAAKGLFGSTAKDLKTHFFGEEKKKEEKKEEKPATPPVTVNVGGEGGGGLMEKYANLLEKNMELKERIKELENEKKP